MIKISLDGFKKDIVKIHLESKNNLDKNIQSKKEVIEKEIVCILLPGKNCRGQCSQRV